MKIFKLLTSQKEQNMKFLMGSEGRKGLWLSESQRRQG